MSALRDRLAGGEKADVLVMPTNILDGYQQSGVVRPQGRAILGLVGINAVVRTGAPKPDLSTPEKVKQAILNSRAIAHATPGETPSGTHMGKLIEKLGITDAMKGKIIHRPALAGGVQLIASGEAEIGILPEERGGQHRRLGTSSDRCRPTFNSRPSTAQLVTASSAAPDAGAAFIGFMCDPAHRAAWTRAGFDPPAI